MESNENEKESWKRRSKTLKLNTVEELQHVLFDSPLIKLPDGKLNPCMGHQNRGDVSQGK